MASENTQSNADILCFVVHTFNKITKNEENIMTSLGIKVIKINKTNYQYMAIHSTIDKVQTLKGVPWVNWVEVHQYAETWDI